MQRRVKGNICILNIKTTTTLPRMLSNGKIIFFWGGGHKGVFFQVDFEISSNFTNVR